MRCILKQFGAMIHIESLIICSYDTTYNMGDFFVSCLVDKWPLNRDQ